MQDAIRRPVGGLGHSTRPATTDDVAAVLGYWGAQEQLLSHLEDWIRTALAAGPDGIENNWRPDSEAVAPLLQDIQTRAGDVRSRLGAVTGQELGPETVSRFIRECGLNERATLGQRRSEVRRKIYRVASLNRVGREILGVWGDVNLGLLEAITGVPSSGPGYSADGRLRQPTAHFGIEVRS